MTAVLAHDQFDSIMGPRRGGGASHGDLPAVTDDATFDLVIRELTRLPDLAADNHSEQLIAHLAGSYQRSAPAFIARKLLPRLDVTAAQTNEHIRVTSSLYVNTIINHIRPLSSQPTEQGNATITAALADKLAADILRPADGEPALPRLLPTHTFFTPDPNGNRSIAQPMLLDDPQWRAVLTTALAADNIIDAEQLIFNAVDPARS